MRAIWEFVDDNAFGLGAGAIMLGSLCLVGWGIYSGQHSAVETRRKLVALHCRAVSLSPQGVVYACDGGVYIVH